MKTLERVARALWDAECEHEGHVAKWENTPEEVRGLFLVKAKAALTALLEPSVEMVRVGVAHEWGCSEDAFPDDVIAETFSVMIQQALQEGEAHGQ